MSIRRVVLVAAVLVWAAALLGVRLHACDCIRLPPPSPAIRTEAQIIFEGRVLEIVERLEHTTATRSGSARTEVRPLDRYVVFEVKRAWRGVTSERVSVSSHAGDCTFPFEIGRDYLVFAYRKDESARPETSICSRTRRLEDAGNILKNLGPPSYVPALKPASSSRVDALCQPAAPAAR